MAGRAKVETRVIRGSPEDVGEEIAALHSSGHLVISVDWEPWVWITYDGPDRMVAMVALYEEPEG